MGRCSWHWWRHRARPDRGTRGPAARADDGPAPPLGREPIFEGLGTHGREVTTASPEAQRYFDQGLCFLYAFNHDEAVRSFRQAAELDPGCAMAWWGVAIALGPHINNPLVPEERGKAAWEAIEKARSRPDAPARWSGP